MSESSFIFVQLGAILSHRMQGSEKLDYDRGVVPWPAWKAPIWIGVLLTAMCAQAADFELVGQLQPEQALVVSLHGATMPFSATTEADPSGRFHFRKLVEGTYVLAVRGLQRTVEVGPSLADSKRRVRITITLSEADTDASSAGRDRVSLRELSIPKEAQREYVDAESALRRRDVATAVEHLKRAVELAPRFSAAWNYLGTIAYQTGKFSEAEGYFRKGLDADPEAYAPLVNLGGVLLNLSKWDEALEYNRRAVVKSPNDALANSQLGMAYFYMGHLDLAEKYLTAAKQIDPAHFSHPQILLAEIDLRRNQPNAAADELEDLLRRHPDLPNAAKIRDEIARLRTEGH
ncbi:MAG TPA: tetratricopeptide repeat protein [Bryobacteraceae bacterium]|jgi:tetratricopeptide (TPR) repeat protein|nr:tetratricopeptide repeat protein [Bryobacteraceae bacterium]